MIENRLFPLVEDMLDWTAKRQQAISANIANVDTPGYRAKDYTFATEVENVQLKVTAADHLAPLVENSNLKMVEVAGKVKDNGNSVDLDREMTEMTKNGLQYIALIQYVNQKLRTLRTSISEGGRV